MTGKYIAYPEYKNSGVVWLGEVPVSWTITKFSYVKTVLTDYTANGSFADLKKNVSYLDEPNYARLVRLTDLRKNLKNSNGVWISEISYNFLKKSALFGGEFLMANVGAYAGLFYEMPSNAGIASLAPNMLMAKFDNSKIFKNYMAYIGESSGVNKQLTLSATASSAQPKLNKDDFKSVKFAFPSLLEQQKIAAFLDYETERIDGLIEKQQQLIALLKEKRQAVISHAVTKGLNPNAPLRHSGVEWLGAIPAHWVVTRAKFLFDFVTSGSRGWAEYYADEGPLFFRIANLTRDTIEPKLVSIQNVAPPIGSEGERAKIKRNDLLISITADLGSVCVARKEIIGGYVSQHVSLCRPNTIVKSADWLAYFVLADAAKEQFVGSAYGGTKIQLSLEDIRELWVALPATDEQEEIAKFINDKLEKFASLEGRAEHQINLLKERRTALISAAVTGKIDVRDWEAPDKNINKKEDAA